MRPIRLMLALLLLQIGASHAAGAQTQARTLEVPASSAWQHARTEMILPPQSGGLTRSEISDLGNAELDIVAQYRGPDGVFATVYLFRTAFPDAPLWFDRALAAMTLRPGSGATSAAIPGPTPFARPGATAASGLRVVFDLSGGQLRSTGLAVAPLGDHLLKIRMSSTHLDGAALDAQLTRFIEDLRWPAPRPDERAAAPIAPCPEPLRLRNARLVPPDMAETLMDALTGVTSETTAAKHTPVYCREPGATTQYGVYRPDAARDTYLIALNDAGIALSLGEAVSLGSLLGEGRGRRRIAMTLHERDSTSVLPSFNRLPPPEQALAVALRGNGPGISVRTEGTRD